MLFDLDGFKSYNDTFGHVAGDALLARLGHKLETAVSHARLGLPPRRRRILRPAAGRRRASTGGGSGRRRARGAWRDVRDHRVVRERPRPARSDDDRLRPAARGQANVHTQARPTIGGARAGARRSDPHPARQAKRTARSLNAESHGSRSPSAVAWAWTPSRSTNSPEPPRCTTSARSASRTPSSTKPGPLDAEEWEFIHQHTVLGERILSAAPALRPVATIVRATHERWDGAGYPDRRARQRDPARRADHRRLRRV